MLKQLHSAISYEMAISNERGHNDIKYYHYHVVAETAVPGQYLIQQPLVMNGVAMASNTTTNICAAPVMGMTPSSSVAQACTYPNSYASAIFTQWLCRQ